MFNYRFYLVVTFSVITLNIVSAENQIGVPYTSPLFDREQDQTLTIDQYLALKKICVKQSVDEKIAPFKRRIENFNIGMRAWQNTNVENLSPFLKEMHAEQKAAIIDSIDKLRIDFTKAQIRDNAVSPYMYHKIYSDFILSVEPQFYISLKRKREDQEDYALQSKRHKPNYINENEGL